jgi:hypothetical protein
MADSRNLMRERPRAITSVAARSEGSLHNWNRKTGEYDE